MAKRREKRERRTFWSDFRRFFVRGLSILLPSILTLWLLWAGTLFVYQNIGEPINRGIRAGVIWVVPEIVPADRLPDWFEVDQTDIAEFRATREGQAFGKNASDATLRKAIIRSRLANLWAGHWYLNASGLMVAIILIYLAGVFLGGILGRRFYTKIEAFIARIPGFKQVYPHVKQLVDLVIGERQVAFQRAVLVEYPRKGIWTVGLVTSDTMVAVHQAAGKPCLAIFIPSTPTPFTGFTISVPADEVKDLPISVDAAIRFFITGGALVPQSQLPPGSSPLLPPQDNGLDQEPEDGPEDKPDAPGRRPSDA